MKVSCSLYTTGPFDGQVHVQLFTSCISSHICHPLKRIEERGAGHERRPAEQSKHSQIREKSVIAKRSSREATKQISPDSSRKDKVDKNEQPPLFTIPIGRKCSKCILNRICLVGLTFQLRLFQICKPAKLLINQYMTRSFIRTSAFHVVWPIFQGSPPKQLCSPAKKTRINQLPQPINHSQLQLHSHSRGDNPFVVITKTLVTTRNSSTAPQKVICDNYQCLTSLHLHAKSRFSINQNHHFPLKQANSHSLPYQNVLIFSPHGLHRRSGNSLWSLLHRTKLWERTIAKMANQYHIILYAAAHATVHISHRPNHTAENSLQTTSA